MSRLAAYLENLQRFGINPGLERIEALLASVDHPQRKYPHILVGGTNGKGSTCEFAARMLAQNGRRVGLFTSPHLYQWNERIRVLPGVGLFEGAIEDDELDALFDDGLPHIEAIAAKLGQPTEFEVLTFLGLWHFARAGVDAAVIEVGLGGKWDATNASDPLVSVVTHVALDHMDRLGNTREEIAADKVCIARANRPFVTGEWKPEVLRVFEEHCEKTGALLEVVKPPFVDDFQQVNNHLAQNIVRVFGEQSGWDVLTDGAGVPVAGRHEVLQHNPRLIIDGANNPEGAGALVDFLNHDRPSHQRVVLVLGILKDKNWREMTQILTGEADVVICCQSDSLRALDAGELGEYAREFCKNIEVVRDVKSAVERARELANPDDTILVTGSFTTIAEVPRSIPFDSSP